MSNEDENTEAETTNGTYEQSYTVGNDMGTDIELQDKDYRGILAGLLVGGTFSAVIMQQLTGNPAPALEALLTLTGMAVAWYFKR